MGTPKIPYTIQAGIAASVNNDEAVLTNYAELYAECR